jgi:hypothetical protein
MNTRLFSTLGAIALIGTTTACIAPPATEAPLERSAYGEISLPPDSQRFGAYPEQIALDAFGMEEPMEGNFSQETQLVEQTSEMAERFSTNPSFASSNHVCHSTASSLK